jgi:hypothetical protein
MGSVESNWPRKISAAASGVLIAAAAFALLLWLLAWLMPKFLLFINSRWAHLLPVITVLLICASGLLRYVRKRRA